MCWLNTLRNNVVKPNQIIPVSVTGWGPFSDLSCLYLLTPVYHRIKAVPSGCNAKCRILACGNLKCEDENQQSVVRSDLKFVLCTTIPRYLSHLNSSNLIRSTLKAPRMQGNLFVWNSRAQAGLELPLCASASTMGLSLLFFDMWGPHSPTLNLSCTGTCALSYRVSAVLEFEPWALCLPGELWALSCLPGEFVPYVDQAVLKSERSSFFSISSTGIKGVLCATMTGSTMTSP